MNEDKPERMPNTPPFVRFVCSAVPMVFDDSLSYYEALCALWKYVQGMTDVINNNATLEEEYILKFNELKTFVDTYFDNLDVQEEINNKLDAMAEDGTLSAIISEYLNSIAIFGYDSVADMAAAENLIDGSYAHTTGFYSKNDGGDALYKIRAKGENETPDEMSVISMDDSSLVAELIISGNIIDPKKFGCKCDGVTDDTAALQACINFTNTLASSNNTWKRTILIPAVIRVTDTINVTFDQFKIQGTSLNNSRIILDGSDAYFNFADSNSNTLFEIEIENVKFYGNYSNTHSLLSFTHCDNIYLHRVETCKGGANLYNISFDHCGIIFMDECTVTGSNDVANYPGNRNGIYVNTLGSILNFTNANCWNLNNLFKFEGTTQNVNIENNWIECIKSLFEVDAVSDMRYMNIKIKGNTINTHSEGSGAFVPTTFNFFSIAMENDTNFFGSHLTIEDNTIYLANVTSINHNSLIYIDQIGGSSSAVFSFSYCRNVFSGQDLNTLGAYVFYNSDNTFYNGFNVQFTSLAPTTIYDNTRLTDKTKIVKCLQVYKHNNLTAPNGIYLGNTNTTDSGNIYYADGDFYAGYNGTIKKLPKRDGTVFTYATGSSDLVQYINDLITALTNANIITHN